MSRFTSTILLFVASSAVPVLQPREADACGGGFWSTTVTVDSSLDAQRTLLVYDGSGSVRHYVQVSYSGSAKEFAWVYPLPSNPDAPVAVDDGEALFTKLDEVTKPQFHVQVQEPVTSGGGCLCLPMMGSAGDNSEGRGDAGADGGGVTVWGGGRVGIFDYAIITAATVDPMIAWLNDNSFRVPAEASPVLEHYVAGGFYFVAMKINPEAEGVTGEGSTTTILFRYADTPRVYPLYMSSIGAAESTSVLLYVLAEHRVQVDAPYANLVIDGADLTVSGTNPDFAVDYEAQFASHIAAAGNRAFVTEFVDVPTGYFLWSTTLADLPTSFYPRLTRLRTTLGPGSMTDDVVLADAPTNDPVSRDFSFTVTVAANASSHAPDFLLALAVPAAIVFFIRGRRRTR
jgi:hypothetical protein